MYNKDDKSKRPNQELKDYVENLKSIDLSFVNCKNKHFEININTFKKFILLHKNILTYTKCVNIFLSLYKLIMCKTILIN